MRNEISIYVAFEQNKEKRRKKIRFLRKQNYHMSIFKVIKTELKNERKIFFFFFF